MHTTKSTANLFSTSHETIRGWAIEFGRHLSPTATPAHGRHRRFNEDDLQVLALIAVMKGQGLLYEDIHAALDAGQRAEPPNSDTDLQTAPQTGIVERLQAERESLLAQLAAQSERAIRAEGQLERVEQQLTHTEQALKAELAAAQAEIVRLNRENAKLELRLKQADD